MERKIEITTTPEQEEMVKILLVAGFEIVGNVRISDVDDDVCYDYIQMQQIASCVENFVFVGFDGALNYLKELV